MDVNELFHISTCKHCTPICCGESAIDMFFLLFSKLIGCGFIINRQLNFTNKPKWRKKKSNGEIVKLWKATTKH